MPVCSCSPARSCPHHHCLWCDVLEGSSHHNVAFSLCVSVLEDSLTLTTRWLPVTRMQRVTDYLHACSVGMQGASALCDSGYHQWAQTVCGFKHASSKQHMEWSARCESARKQVECVFGSMKQRFRILRLPMLYNKAHPTAAPPAGCGAVSAATVMPSMARLTMSALNSRQQARTHTCAQTRTRADTNRRTSLAYQRTRTRAQ